MNLACIFFGHQFFIKQFTGQYDEKYRDIDPLGRPAALYIRKELDHCDRCGKKLRPLEGDGTK